MAVPKTVTLNVNDVIQGIIDQLQASKNLVVNIGGGLVDIGVGGVEAVNGKLDEAIDALQKMISD